MHFNPKRRPFIETLHLSSFPQLQPCQGVRPRPSERLEPRPCRLSLLTSTLSVNLSNPSFASRSGVYTRQSVSLLTFTSRHFVYILTSSAVLFWMTQRWTLLTEAIYEKARICSEACFFFLSIFFQLYFPKQGFFFPNRKHIVTCRLNSGVFVWLLQFSLANITTHIWTGGGRPELIFSRSMYFINNSHTVLMSDPELRGLKGPINHRNKVKWCLVFPSPAAAFPLAHRGNPTNGRCFRHVGHLHQWCLTPSAMLFLLIVFQAFPEVQNIFFVVLFFPAL